MGHAKTGTLILIVVLAMIVAHVPASAISPLEVIGAPGFNYPSFGPEMAGRPESAGPTGPVDGQIRVLIIPVEFSDVKHQRSTTEIYNDYFGQYPSVASYYDEVSYGKLKVTGTVADWIAVPSAMARYGADGSGSAIDQSTGVIGSLYLVMDAQTAFDKAQTTVNAADYDYLVVVHAGAGQESNATHSNLIWSVAYQSGLKSAPANCYCKSAFDAANVVPESEERGAVPFGVYAHEFGHLLGLPDMYRGQKRLMGPWELMDGGVWNGAPYGSSPAELSAWSRLKLGWLTAAQEMTVDAASPGFATLNPLEAPKNGIVVVRIQATSSVYYMVEVRRPIGYDRGLPGYGVVAYTVSNATGTTTLQKVGDLAAAFNAGHLYQSPASLPSAVAFKVFAGFANGTYLVGFGPSSFILTATLTINIEPAAFNATVIVNGVSYATDKNGTVAVLDYSGNPTGFNVTVPGLTPVGVGIRAKFNSWSNGATSKTVAVPGANATLTAMYGLQYYVGVESPYGAASGIGWYDDGSNATVSIPGIVNATAPGTRYAFTGWGGGANETANPITFRVQLPVNLTAEWKTQFYVDVDTGGHAAASGSGWYDQNATAEFAMKKPEPVNGAWYVFQDWTGDYAGSDLSGTVTVTRPLHLAARWSLLDWVIIRFVDASGQQVSAARIGGSRLAAANGTAIPVGPDGAAGLWLLNGTYRVAEVRVMGTNVAPDGQSFTTAPNGVALIRLALFDMVFDTRDTITMSPVSGVTVTVTLPDGSKESNSTGRDGKIVFGQLPMASYSYQVTGGLALQSSGSVAIGATGSQTITVRLVFLPSLLAVVAAAAAAALTAFMLAKRRGVFGSPSRPRRKRKTAAKRRRKGKSRAAAILRGEIPVYPDERIEIKLD